MIISIDGLLFYKQTQFKLSFEEQLKSTLHFPQNTNHMLPPRVYSQSLKKLKKQQVFDYSIQKIYKMQQEIQKSAQQLNTKQKPITNCILARKQLIQHKHSKNKLQQEVDKIMKNLVNSNHLQLKNDKINQKHKYNHYRIETEPNQGRNSKKKVRISQNLEEENEQNSKLPRIMKSASHSVFEKSKSRKLKTQHELFERLSQNHKSKMLDYINIDSAIRQYRSGMTSLIKGVYYNPHNPYKNSVK